MSFIREYILVMGNIYIMANSISIKKHTCWTQISRQGMNVEVARTSNVLSCDYKDGHLC